jgi:formylglycine-generating enzyme required for sulfatase activity/photosystem II stability/assembly factor-like uncharacterized protein
VKENMMKRKKRIKIGVSVVLMMIIIVACQFAGLTGITDPEDTGAVTESDPLVEPEDAYEVLLPTDSAALIPEPTFETMVNPLDGAVMVHVPAGDFLMGSHQAHDGTKAFEPEQLVYLDEFWIYQVPVTNAQFSAFVAATGFETHAEEWGWSWAVEKENYNHASWHSPEGPGSSVSGREDHPVVHVNRDDAAAYCEWAGGRLPSEAEWEKAARGPDGNQYPWGDEAPTCEKANLHSCVGSTTPVGVYLQGISPFGVLDMAGNVLEWTLDLFDPPPIVYVVQRGGSFEDQQPLSFLRYRGNAFTTAYHYGFRCRYPGNDDSIEPVEETTLLTWEDGTWQLVTDNAEWGKRFRHTAVVLPDDGIVLMGGALGRELSGETEQEYKRNDVWRSTDQGATWTLVTEDAGWSARSGHTSVALPDGSIVLMGGFDMDRNSKNDVWRSTDQGATWTLMTANAAWVPRSNHTSVVLPDGSIVLMGGDAGNATRFNDVWRSIDQGETWVQMTEAAPWTPRSGHTSAVLPDGSIVIMCGVPDISILLKDVWRSTDQGITWTLMTDNAAWETRFQPTSIALPDGSLLLMGGSLIGGWNDIWHSTDLGSSWQLITSDADWPGRWGHTTVLLPEGSILLIGGIEFRDLALSDVWRMLPAGFQGH